MRTPILYLLIVFVLASCGKKETEFTKIIYKFHDSSVPPEYHRSFTITLTKDTIQRLIDSYGDTIKFEKKSVDASVLEEAKKKFNEGGIANCAAETDDDCNGGTGVSIYCYSVSKNVFKGYKSSCGGKNTGDMCGETEPLSAFLRKQFE